MNRRGRRTGRRYWLSCERFTISAETDSQHRLVNVAPIANKFRGRHVKSLVDWMRTLGGFRWADLDDPELRERD